MKEKSKKVISFGTFDLFHKGHKSYLKQAKKLGDYLIVVVARDRNVKIIKKRLPAYKEAVRMKKIEETGLADKVVLGNLYNKYNIIKKHKPDIIALGYDQAVNIFDLRKNLLKFGLSNVKIKRLAAYNPQVYKSSKIKDGLKL